MTRSAAPRLNPGRLAAARVLLSVDRGGHAEELLAELAPPEGPDRRLAWHLALGVLRRRGALDAVLARAAGRALDKVDAAPLAALRLGLFELHHSRTAAHAAVDQAVEICRQLGVPRATGFVNAVLRKAAGMPLPQDPGLDVPAWLRERLGPEAAPWLARLAEAAPLCGVARAPRTEIPGLATHPARAAGQEVPGAFVVEEAQGPVEALPGFAQGLWWVMDPAAVAVADLVPVGPGSTVLDACAAPGGKSLRLASTGASVTAVDQDPERLGLVEEAALRTGLPLSTRVHDWLQGPMPEGERFDLVLVDAPCTGLGTLRRHPEIRWRRQPSDPAAMALRQRRILAAAAEHVAPGGRLVYAVCSPMPEEGPQVALDLPGWTCLRSWSSVPPQGDEDAFQAFVLARTDAPPDRMRT